MSSFFKLIIVINFLHFIFFLIIDRQKVINKRMLLIENKTIPLNIKGNWKLLHQFILPLNSKRLNYWQHPLSPHILLLYISPVQSLVFHCWFFTDAQRLKHHLRMFSKIQYNFIKCVLIFIFLMVKWNYSKRYYGILRKYVHKFFRSSFS